MVLRTSPTRFDLGSFAMKAAVLFLVVLIGGGAEPQGEREARTAVSIENADEFRERIDEFVERARLKTGFSGVVVVARKGEPVYQGSFGFSQLKPRTPNSLDTPFRIASLSKQFTAAAILSLEAEGKLKIEDPVQRYLPEFAAEPYGEITIHHLLTHTSGLPRSPENGLAWFRWEVTRSRNTMRADGSSKSRASMGGCTRCTTAPTQGTSAR